MENANLLSEISASGRLVARRGNFLKKCKGLITYYALFGQLVHGASAGYRVGVVYPNISGIKSNNWVYFKVVCQVVW
jgi:hypothetical protein